MNRLIMRIGSLMMLAVALAFFLSTNAHGDATVRAIECKLPQCVILMAAELESLIESNNANFDRAEKLQAELDKLKKSCAAKLEVTEPPKHFVPKKERDS